MTSYYSEEELKKFGFSKIGKNVFISRKSSIYGCENISIGNNVRIDDFCILSGHIEIGNYIHIAAFTALYGGKDGIFIEDFANLSSRISVYSISDDYSGETMTNPMIPDKFKNVKSAPVYIGKHAIIGASCVVLPGVRIAEGSSFGSFSLINSDSEEWSINVGIPAHKMKERSRELLNMEQKFMKEMENNWLR